MRTVLGVLLWLSAGHASAAVRCMAPTDESFQASEEGIRFHQDRRLSEASAAYARALKLAAPRKPSPAEIALIEKFAPRLWLHKSEFFGLKDFAAVMHPEKPWIAYHMFWEDDIDFPDDNDPSDHEVIWIQLDAGRSLVMGVYTYFHGKIVRAEKFDNPRASIAVQWGKHGSMPMGWADMRKANEETWRRLNQKGRDFADSPLSRGWPLKFPGTLDEFLTFSKTLDPVAHLRRSGMMIVSHFNNAVINRHFLRYNFAAKTEWPEAACGERVPAADAGPIQLKIEPCGGEIKLQHPLDVTLVFENRTQADVSIPYSDIHHEFELEITGAAGRLPENPNTAGWRARPLEAQGKLTLAPGESRSFPYHMDWIYGLTEPGRYRIVAKGQGMRSGVCEVRVIR